jgi:hypothetical protein
MARAADDLADDLELVKPYTKSTPERLASMADALRAIEEEEIPGDIVECGVWRGGNIMLARLMCPQRVCWIYDTFDGMTEPGPFDVKRDGERAIDRWHAKQAGGTKWDAVSLDELQAGFVAIGLSMEKIHFVSGRVENSLQVVRPFRVAILRLDVDWYEPTKAALQALYARVVRKGFLIVDDYGHWMGCKKAVDEYFGKAAMPPHWDADYSCRVFRKC